MEELDYYIFIKDIVIVCTVLIYYLKEMIPILASKGIIHLRIIHKLIILILLFTPAIAFKLLPLPFSRDFSSFGSCLSTTVGVFSLALAMYTPIPRLRRISQLAPPG